MQRLKDSQGKFIPSKKAFSTSSKTFSRVLNFPFVSKLLSFYNSFKSNHKIIGYILGLRVIEWFYSPFFREADHYLASIEHSIEWGTGKLYDSLDMILYLPVLLIEGPLVYYVNALAQVSVINKAFRLIDSLSDLIVPVELEQNVGDFRFIAFQNLETNFPFLRKMRRKVSIRAVWNLPKNFLKLAWGCFDSLLCSLSYVFYLLFIADSPQEKARYIKPRPNSRKISLGPASLFSLEPIPIISITPPKSSTPKVSPNNNSNMVFSRCVRESKPVPQHLKKK